MAQQTVFFDNAVVWADGCYKYDTLYQLIQAQGREHPGQQPTHEDMVLSSLPHPNNLQALRRYSEQYFYDAVGNIERVTHQSGAERWTRHYECAPGSNRLVKTSAPGDPTAGPSSHAYSHDAHGNMTTMPHLADMRWDYEDRLEYVDRQGGGKVYFVYDSGDERVRKVYEHSDLIEESTYLGEHEVY